MTLIRTEPFVPLISAATSAASSERASFQATILPQSDKAQKFQPAESAITSSPAPGQRNSHCEPRVTIQRDGDRINGIRIQCSCGEVIDLACVYQPEAKA